MPDLADAAQRYVDRRPWLPGAGRSLARLRALDPPTDEALCLDIADAYEAAPVVSDDPAVPGRYRRLKAETLEQFDAVRAAGIQVRPWRGEGQPYRDSRDLIERVTRTGTLRVFLTSAGHGPAGATGGHPMAEPSGIVSDGVRLAHNDVFRAVHDAFGHVLPGAGFGPRGEFRATWCHLQLYSPPVHPVLLAEQIGQICWFFFGPHTRGPGGRRRRPGEAGYVPPARRPYPVQKVIGLDGAIAARFTGTFARSSDVQELV
ncbi:hypothetical protein [Dactylosporangium sp. CA-139066]|uniref:hypothetical protein n=1 Tax=Dactylosporangium sp. CA-139066 TaxID=3239930 RepID=UPI003D8E0FD7